VHASIAGATDPTLDCAGFTAANPVITRIFQVAIQGGTGNYAIAWDFNRGRGTAQVTPPTASDVRQQQVSYRITSTNNFGSYTVTVQVSDKGAPSLPQARDQVTLIIGNPQTCAGP
jgi:hypothetical protein